MRVQCQKLLQDNPSNLVDFGIAIPELQQRLVSDYAASYDECAALVNDFEQPATILSDLLESFKSALDADKQSVIVAEKISKKKNTALRIQLGARARQLRELNAEFNAYHEQFTSSSVGEPLHDYKQSLKDSRSLSENFPDDHYQDIEGLCKAVDLDEIVENDYSLTPGRYVGYSIKIDEDFDYQGRMVEIHSELETLNNAANILMDQIQVVKL